MKKPKFVLSTIASTGVLNLMTIIPIFLGPAERYYIGFSSEVSYGKSLGRQLNLEATTALSLSSRRSPPTPSEGLSAALSVNHSVLALPDDDVRNLFGQLDLNQPMILNAASNISILSNLDDILLITSLGGKILHVSKAIEKILGYDRRSLYDTSFAALIHPDDMNAVGREIQSASKNDSVHLVFRIRNAFSALYHWFDARGCAVPDRGAKHGAGGATYVVLVGRTLDIPDIDTTTLDVADEALQRSWAQVSSTGIFLHTSRGFHDLIHEQPDHVNPCKNLLVCKRLQDFACHTSRVRIDLALERAQETLPVTLSHCIRTSCGKILRVESTISATSRPAAQATKQSSFVLRLALLGDPPLPTYNDKAFQPQSDNSALQPSSQLLSCTEDACVVPSHPSQIPSFTRQFSNPFSGAFAKHTNDASRDTNTLLGPLLDPNPTGVCWQAMLQNLVSSNRQLELELGELLKRRKTRGRWTKKGEWGRECTNCHAKDSPEWRRGPNGKRELCNRCGLRWKKMEDEREERESKEKAPAKKKVKLKSVEV